MNAVLDLPVYQTAVRNTVVWSHPLMEKRPQLTSFLIALAVHAVLLIATGSMFGAAPEYGIDMNQGGMDVYLVAAPAQPVQKIAERSEVIQPEALNAKSEMILPLPEPVQTAVTPLKENKKAMNRAISEQRGDGSSTVLGQNNTSFSSSGSGQADAKPGYLKNSPPPYPAEALRKGQEGVVYLAVHVDRRGKSLGVEIDQTSGYPLLDDAALKTVKKWKFSPARIGGMAIDARVIIPVRFRLEDARKKH